MNPFEPYLPPDFVDFWEETSNEAHSAILDFERREHGREPHHVIHTFTFRGSEGQPRHGWIAVPDEPEDGRGFLWVPPYGRESLLPNAYGTRIGFVSASLNFFGHEAFHQETYRRERGYFAEGVENPRTWIFRTMFKDAVLAMRVLAACEEVDAQRVGAMGMSQGAGLSIWLGAWCPMVKAVCADMPFLGAMGFALNRNAHRYPLKELIDRAETLPNGRQSVLDTIAYFDTMNQATRCKVPTHVSLGLKDPAVRPESAEAIFEALPGRKVLRRYEVGHDWTPEMVENNRDWLMENL